MDNPPRYVSGQSLFSMVEEQLASGKRVRFPVSGTSMTPWIIHNRDQIELISAKGLRLKKGRHHPISALFRQVYPAPYYKK